MTKQNNANDMREFSRLNVHCPARIRIGNRQYAAYVQNISEGGVRFTTLSPIREVGPVLLQLPDLPPVRGQVRWNSASEAGIAFHLKLDSELFRKWAGQRTDSANGEDVADRHAA